MFHLNNALNRVTKLMKPIKIVEVGLRDGLQNEPKIITTNQKLDLFNKLTDCGIQHLEVGSLVSPKWVPQMADTPHLFKKISSLPNVKLENLSVLVPNAKGFNRSLDLGVKNIAIMGAASETFCKKNINCSIIDSLNQYREICKQAHKNNIKVRGYVSCVFGCPYEKYVPIKNIVFVATELYNMGCYEISLGDTIGCATQIQTLEIISTLSYYIPISKLAVHYHDTQGRALENIQLAINMGISTIDSSIANLGGCNYSPGATGNVATEKVVKMLIEKNIPLRDHIDIDKLNDTSKYISQLLTLTH